MAVVAGGRTAIGQPARDPAAVRVELVWSTGLAEIQAHAARDGSDCPGTLPWSGTVTSCTPGPGPRTWTLTIATQDGATAWGAAYQWPDRMRVIVVADYCDALKAHSTTPPVSLSALTALAADPRRRWSRSAWRTARISGPAGCPAAGSNASGWRGR